MHFCPNCRAHVEENNNFCSQCGAKLKPSNNNNNISSSKIVPINTGIPLAAPPLGIPLGASPQHSNINESNYNNNLNQNHTTTSSTSSSSWNTNLAPPPLGIPLQHHNNNDTINKDTELAHSRLAIPLADPIPIHTSNLRNIVHYNNNHIGDISILANYKKHFNEYENKYYNKTICEIISKCGPPSWYCCLTCFCSWIPLSQVVSRLENPLYNQGKLKRSDKYNNIFGILAFLLIISTLFPPFFIIFVIVVLLNLFRAHCKIIKYYKIKTDPFTTCFKLCFCSCCSIIQMIDLIWDIPPEVKCDNLENAIHQTSDNPLDISGVLV